MSDASRYRALEDVPWAAWQGTKHATLCFVIRGGEVLLIHKKRGLGAGKINGPGGHVEAGETPEDCAVREVQEELGVTPKGVRYAGELRFQFTDGLALHGYVYRADDCIGTAHETDEAIPCWTPLDQVPFERMWADDVLWFPHLLSRRIFSGRFLFDGDTMLGHAIELSS